MLGEVFVGAGKVVVVSETEKLPTFGVRAQFHMALAACCVQ